MATINAVLLPAKELKGGRHKIRISVAHNGETRYIATSIVIDSIKEFKNGAIVKRTDAAYLNTKLRGILQRYQEMIDEMEYINALSCPELIYQLKNGRNDRHHTLLSVYEEYMEHSNLKPNSIKSYRGIWNIISKYLPVNILVGNLTQAHILSLESSLKKRKLSPSALKSYLIFLKSLLSYARRFGYVQFRIDPFAGFKLPNAEVRQAWLTVEEIKRIRDVEITNKYILKCRDLFMLSYYLGGINMIDLLSINFNESLEVIHYVREKTKFKCKINKFVEFEIPEEAKEIIERYKGRDGRISVPAYQRKVCCNSFFVANMPKLAEVCGIRKLIYYAARKSFSQHAFNLGISTSVIDYILGHKVDKGGTSLYSYIYVTPEMATKAVRQVLDNLK